MGELTSLSLPSPGKINHFLHIVGKRPDGYHNLQTAFQFLEKSDQLHFTLSATPHIRIFPNPMNGVLCEENLIYKAALALQQKAPITKGVDIHIDKCLPLGGGLGGGSSNAATTLIALNILWKLDYSISDLILLGKTLGADVPFFLFGQSAFAEGIGEELTPLPLPESWVFVVIPPCAVSTAEMFAERDLTTNTPRFKIGALAQGEIRLSQLGNDFEPIARKRYELINEAMNWLSRYTKAKLSGSGACVFGSFPQREEAEAVLAALPQPFKGFVTRGLNTSLMALAASKLGFPNK